MLHPPLTKMNFMNDDVKAALAGTHYYGRKACNSWTFTVKYLVYPQQRNPVS